MNQNIIKMLVASGLASCVATAHAEISADNFSANIGVVTDYVWRGWSLTGEDPAIQGGFDFNHKSGFYAGVWGSNVDFPPVHANNMLAKGSGTPSLAASDSVTPPPPPPPPPGGGPTPPPPPPPPPASTDSASLEIDVYGGWTKQFGDFGVNLGVISYFFFDDPRDREFTDIFVGGNWKWLSARIAEKVAKGNHPYHAADTYLEMNANIPLPQDFKIRLHVGKSIFDDLAYDPVDYGAGVVKTIKGFELAVMYYDMDSDGNALYGQFADPRVVGSVKKRFP